MVTTCDSFLISAFVNLCSYWIQPLRHLGITSPKLCDSCRSESKASSTLKLLLRCQPECHLRPVELPGLSGPAALPPGPSSLPRSLWMGRGPAWHVFWDPWGVFCLLEAEVCSPPGDQMRLCHCRGSSRLSLGSILGPELMLRLCDQLLWGCSSIWLHRLRGFLWSWRCVILSAERGCFSLVSCTDSGVWHALSSCIQKMLGAP